MGLDNGITIKKTNKTERIGLDRFYNLEYDGSDSLEVCYWRKCWGLRNDIINYLSQVYGTSTEEYEWTLDRADIFNIIEIIKSWRNKKKWNAEGESIWTYKEMKEHLIKDIENLTYLYAKMESHYHDFLEDEIKVVFYDSY